jgi:hypothetical protein
MNIFAPDAVFLFPIFQQPTIVDVKVIHNGHNRPAPRAILIPVRNGKYEAPAEFMAAKSVTLETDVEGSHIRLTTEGAIASWSLFPDTRIQVERCR